MLSLPSLLPVPGTLRLRLPDDVGAPTAAAKRFLPLIFLAFTMLSECESFSESRSSLSLVTPAPWLGVSLELFLDELWLCRFLVDVDDLLLREDRDGDRDHMPLPPGV